MDEKEIIFGNSFLAIPLELGSALGNFDEAVFIQFIHRWCLNAKKHERSHNFKEGYYWTYMTYKDMEEQLPMFSESKIKRIIKSLKDEGYIVVDKFNQKKYDRTNWYRVNYDALQQVLDHWVKMNYPLGQIDLMDEVRMNQPIPKSSSKSSSKSIKRYSLCAKGGALKAYAEVYEQYQNKKHPTVTLDQLNELEKQLSATDVETYPEIFRDMAHIHFQNLPKGNDGHILAFVGKEGRSPLKRYYELALELPF